MEKVSSKSGKGAAQVGGRFHLHPKMLRSCGKAVHNAVATAVMRELNHCGHMWKTFLQKIWLDVVTVEKKRCWG